MYNKQFELYYLYQKSKIIYNLYNKNFNKYISKNEYVTWYNMTSNKWKYINGNEHNESLGYVVDEIFDWSNVNSFLATGQNSFFHVK